MNRLIFWALACVAGFAVAWPQQARSQALEVHPVVVELAPGQMATTLHITNEGPASAIIQLRSFAWTQQAKGSDQLSPSEKLAFSPPFVTLPPNQSQVVRLILQRPPTTAETTYRLLLDELPPPHSARTRGVRLALHLSIPVFAEVDQKAQAAVSWQLVADGRGGGTLIAVNRGSRHASFNKITISAPGFRPIAMSSNGSPYILAGAERRWHIAGAAGLMRPGIMLHLTARTSNGSHIRALLPVSGPR